MKAHQDSNRVILFAEIRLILGQPAPATLSRTLPRSAFSISASVLFNLEPKRCSNLTARSTRSGSSAKLSGKGRITRGAVASAVEKSYGSRGFGSSEQARVLIVKSRR